MTDKKLENIRAEIERLRNEETKRLEVLADPERQKIRETWEMVVSGLKRLDELGEDIEDGDGHSIYIQGVSFLYDGTDLTEN